MHKIIIKTVAFICAMFVVVGCAVNETYTATVKEDGTTEKILESNSGVLSRNLSIENVKTGFVGNLLKTQATIRNESRRNFKFQYKMKWLDKDGFEIDIDGEPWTPMTITSYESKTVEGLAPNPTAKSFKILVQD